MPLLLSRYSCYCQIIVLVILTAVAFPRGGGVGGGGGGGYQHGLQSLSAFSNVRFFAQADSGSTSGSKGNGAVTFEMVEHERWQKFRGGDDDSTAALGSLSDLLDWAEGTWLEPYMTASDPSSPSWKHGLDNNKYFQKKMVRILESIPNLKTYPLAYVLEYMSLKHKPNTLWLEFGVLTGKSINYISLFTENAMYGFDSFEGLPEKWRDGFEKGTFDLNGQMPVVNKNVVLVKGWFEETLPAFIKAQSKKVSFIHLDADLYSSTKFILNQLKEYIDTDCVIVFDELVNYEGFDGDSGELKAFYEFLTENNVSYDWIGMNEKPFGMTGYFIYSSERFPRAYTNYESVALVIHSINSNGNVK